MGPTGWVSYWSLEVDKIEKQLKDMPPNDFYTAMSVRAQRTLLEARLKRARASLVDHIAAKLLAGE